MMLWVAKRIRRSREYRHRALCLEIHATSIKLATGVMIHILGWVASNRIVFESTCHRVENIGGPRKIFKHESGNSILLGTGASPHVSGNSILDTNAVKEIWKGFFCDSTSTRKHFDSTGSHHVNVPFLLFHANPMADQDTARQIK